MSDDTPKQKQQHTPGPWFAGKSTPRGARVLTTQQGADGVVAANIENRANARLIAAAPEMLRVLRTTLKSLQWHYDCCSVSPAACATTGSRISQAMVLLAKIDKP